MPSEKLCRMPQVVFSLMLRLSSWARLLMMVISNSPLESIVQMFSFSKKTSQPYSFSFRMVIRLSTVFLAQRLML